MKCEIYNLNELKQYKYVVILSRYQGKILLSRHRNRTTWETQGGHIEKGETPLAAARRELYEESGAVEFEIEPLCDYGTGEDVMNGTGGMAFTAEISRLEALPDSEMAEVRTFDILPENLTYREITPILFAEIGCYFYKKATMKDLHILVQSRLETLRAANGLEEDTELGEVEAESAQYYAKSLDSGRHVAYLVYDAHRVIGTGGISFYQVMPTYHNATGRKAYVMNMYTNPAYRRRGIARKLLKLLVAEAADRGIGQVALEATESGRPLYEKCGFVQARSEMELQICPDGRGVWQDRR